MDIRLGVFQVVSRLSGRGFPTQPLDEVLGLAIVCAGFEDLINLSFCVALNFNRRR